MSGGRALRIGVVGSYGGLNLGDEAILTCVLDSLRQIRPTAQTVVFSRRPDDTRARFGTAAVAYVGASRRRLVEAESGLDLLVVGGGGVLHDGLVGTVMRPVAVAQRLGVPTFGYALGAGPLTDRRELAPVRETVEQMTDLTVRDEGSGDVLRRIGTTRRITVTADAAVLLEPETFTEEMLAREGIDAGARLVGVSVREPGPAADRLDRSGYHVLLARITDLIICRFRAQVVFVPMERGDIAHARTVLSVMRAPGRARILSRRYTPGQIAGFMRHLDVAVGMRLHFLMFAARAGVPILPLPCAGKVVDFAQAVGAPVLPGTGRMPARPLLAELDRLWDGRHERAEGLRQRIGTLRERARHNQERCRALIETLDPAPDATPVAVADGGVPASRP